MIENFVDPDDDPRVHAVIDATPVIDGPSTDPRMSAAMLHVFVNDLAQGIKTHKEIATRYGFQDLQHLFVYLQRHPEVRRRIKEHKAIWESDDAVELRIKKLAAISLLDALPQTTNIMNDELHPPAIRLDALKAHARIAGVDTTGAPKERGGELGGGAVGGRFSINIVFPNAGKTETFTTVRTDPPPAVIEAEPAE